MHVMNQSVHKTVSMVLYCQENSTIGFWLLQLFQKKDLFSAVIPTQHWLHLIIGSVLSCNPNASPWLHCLIVLMLCTSQRGLTFLCTARVQCTNWQQAVFSGRFGSPRGSDPSETWISRSRSHAHPCPLCDTQSWEDKNTLFPKYVRSPYPPIQSV